MQQILRHCEDVASGTISKKDLEEAIMKTSLDNNKPLSPEQVSAFVDQVFISAGGRD